jgi:hypothetical protein
MSRQAVVIDNALPALKEFCDLVLTKDHDSAHPPDSGRDTTEREKSWRTTRRLAAADGAGKIFQTGSSWRAIHASSFELE